MRFEESTLTLGGETREIKDLAFVNLGQVGTTDAKGVTTVVSGEYTFSVSETSLTFRHKAKGRKASGPRKTVKSFAELEKLPFKSPAVQPVTELPKESEVTKDLDTEPKVSPVVEDNQNQKNSSAESTEEEPTMAKVNVEGKLIEIPAEAQAVLKKLGVTGETVQLAEFDAATAKAKNKDLEILSKFEEVIEKEVATDSTPVAPAAPEAPVTPVAPTTPEAPAASALQGSNIFATGDNQTAAPTRGGTRAAKSEEELKAAREEREFKKQKDLAIIKENVGKIEELRSKNSEISDANEAMAALKELLLIDGKLPMFRTLVPSDTRLAVQVKNNVKPADRVYHPSLQNKAEYTAVGKNIEAKYAKGEFEIVLRESNPSQPSGFFVYVPECLMNFTPTKLAMHSEREMVLQARESGSRELAIKFYPKVEIINLLAILNADMAEYNLLVKAYEIQAPHIYLTSRTDAVQNIPVFSLRAKDSEGRPTKLSIRKFIPLATHNVVKTSSKEFNAKLTTDALFRRLLINIPEGAPANKFSQLVQSSAALFTTHADGEITYNQFKNSETVVAYNSTTARPAFVEVELPLVVESTPSASGNAKVRAVFSKSKHTETGYRASFKEAKEAVGEEINKQRRQTTKSIISGHAEEIARIQAINDLLTGNQLKIK